MLLRIILCLALFAPTFAAQASILSRATRTASGVSEVLQQKLDNIGKHVRQFIDINAQDPSGKTALHRAVEDNNLEEVEELLRRGADITIPDHSGNTAVSLAIENNEIMAMLMKYGTDTVPDNVVAKKTFALPEYNGKLRVITANGETVTTKGDVLPPGSDQFLPMGGGTW